MHRLFAAIRPPEPVRDLLIDVMDAGVSDFRWQSDEQLHLTLRFIGEVERPLANDIASELGRVQFPAFQLRIAGIGKFERRSGGVLWAGIEPKSEMVALASKIERACQSAGVEPEHRAFHPHITLARWSGRRTGEVDGILKRHHTLKSEPFGVDSFILYESRLSRHGAHYEAVAEYALA